MKASKVDKGDFIAKARAIQLLQKVSQKKSILTRLLVPWEPWRKQERGGLGRSQVVAKHPVAEQPPEPFKSLGISLVRRPIPRLPTCVLSATDRALKQRPTSEFVSLRVAHIKERSPTAPPSNILINYTWRVWGPQKQLGRLNSRVNTHARRPGTHYLRNEPLSTQPRCVELCYCFLVQRQNKLKQGSVSSVWVYSTLRIVWVFFIFELNCTTWAASVLNND